MNLAASEDLFALKSRQSSGYGTYMRGAVDSGLEVFVLGERDPVLVPVLLTSHAIRPVSPRDQSAETSQSVGDQSADPSQSSEQRQSEQRRAVDGGLEEFVLGERDPVVVPVLLPGEPTRPVS